MSRTKIGAGVLDVECALCGGNDEHPREHTLDCSYSINRFTAIDGAAQELLKKPDSKAAFRRLNQGKPVEELPALRG